VKAEEKLSKLQAQLNAAGYQDKVDSEVKEIDAERLKDLVAEVESWTSFVASLEKLNIN
jgi:hypothetical protein